MKKHIALLMALVVSTGLLGACASTPTTTTAGSTETSAASGTETKTNESSAGEISEPKVKGEAKTPKAAEAGSIVKFGVGILGSAAKSKEFTQDKGGVVQNDVVAAAVGFDKDGKVASITFDNAQTKIEFNPDGTLKTDLQEAPKTKQEKGPEYGMVKASKIGLEWNQQIENLSAWMQGKTIEEIKAMKVAAKDEGHPAVPQEEDLKTGVSISVEDYQAAVEEAWKNAVEIKDGADKVGLGINVDVAEFTKPKEGDKGAVGQPDTEIMAVALKGDKVVASFWDIVQGKVAFDPAGKLVTDVKADLASKRDLGEKYGMVKASKIKKEWFQQADAFQKWTEGKTKDEILAMPQEKGAPSDADLKTQVSVHIDGALKTIAEAIEKAR